MRELPVFCPHLRIIRRNFLRNFREAGLLDKANSLLRRERIVGVWVCEWLLGRYSLAPDLMCRFFTLAGTVYERTTEEGREVGRVFDQTCADPRQSDRRRRGRAEAVCRESPVSAVSSNQYEEHRALIPAIALAQPWASAYVVEIRALLQRLLGEPPGPNGECSRVLRRALRDLDSPPSAA